MPLDNVQESLVATRQDSEAKIMSDQELTGQLRDELERFLGSLTQGEGYARNTVSAYRNDLNQLADYLFKLEPPIENWSAVTSSTLTNYVEQLRGMQIVKRNGATKSVAPSTVARKIAAVKSFFGFLKANAVIAADPSSALEAPKIAKRTPRTMTDEDVELLLAAPGEGNSPKVLRDHALLELLYATGMRVSELVALNVEDVNLTERTVRVRNDDEGRGLSNRERSVPINEQAAQAVAVYLERGRAGLARNSQHQTALFLNQRGQQLTRQGMWLIIKEYAAKANLAYEVTPHVLRHSFAAHMLRQNKASLSEIQRVLGHANISTTQIYMQPSEPAVEPQPEPEL